MPQVCYGIKIWTHLGHFRTLQCFVLTISGCFLECAMGHCPAGRPMATDGDPASDTGPYIAPKNSLVVLRFPDAMHTVKASGSRSSKAAPKHRSSSTIFACRDCVLFFKRPHFVVCKLPYQKALLWSHLSTGRSLRMILASPGKFWQTPVWHFYVSVSSGVLLGRPP